MFRNQISALICLCCAVLCSFARVAQAQVTAGPLTFGARIGGGMSWIGFDQNDLVIRFDDPDVVGTIPLADSRRFGTTGGVTVSYEVARRWGLEARLLLASQGSTLRGTSQLLLTADPDAVVFATATVTFRTKYLYIPVLARASFGAPAGRFYVGAGPSFGFLMSAKRGEELRANEQGTNNRAESTGEIDIKDDMTSSVLTVSFLGGWETDGTSRIRGFLEAGYDVGTTDLFSSEFGLQPAKHRGFTFMAGVGF